MDLARYWRTLRYLRWRQIQGQLTRRCTQKFRSPEKVSASIWEMPGMIQNPPRISPPVPLQSSRALAEGRFHFIGREVNFGSVEAVDWDAPGQPRLWRYNLHYFDWLWSLHPAHGGDWQIARRLTLGWIQNHTPNKNACGWEPYPTSLRLINWALLFGIRTPQENSTDTEFLDLLLASLGRQTHWLESNLETHIQANHLLENLVALICVASIFPGPHQQRILTRYLPRLADEIDEQILPDGMHYECSPMYHLRILWGLEMLSAVGNARVREKVTEPAERMRRALQYLKHPDGKIALFNDAALNIYQDTWQEAPSPGPWELAEAGYYGMRDGSGNYLIVDAGAVGPDHQPGHAHADFFSFELSLKGERVITDTGSSTYEAGPERAYERSTAAHNTIEVENTNSVEVWSSFRVGRRSVPEILEWQKSQDGLSLRVRHSGYRHLKSRATHQRVFQWKKEVLIIEDQLRVEKSCKAISRIHFAPGVKVEIQGSQIHGTKGIVHFWIQATGVEHSEMKVVETMASHNFGTREKRLTLEIHKTVKPSASDWRIEIHWNSNDEPGPLSKGFE